MPDLVDIDDFCRACRGRGYFTDPGDRPGTTITETCWQCRGSGKRTVRVDDLNQTETK